MNARFQVIIYLINMYEPGEVKALPEAVLDLLVVAFPDMRQWGFWI